MKYEDYSSKLDYGIMGFNRRQIMGVTGIGENTGVTTVCNVLNYELTRMGKDKKIVALDDPENVRDMDRIVCVIDPSPLKIKSNIGKYREMRSLYEDDNSRIIFILNMMNEGVDIDALQKFLDFSFVYVQKMIDRTDIYRTEYMNKDVMRNVDYEEIRKLAREI